MVFGIVATSADANEKGGDRPQYVITVTQGGKALGDIVLELFPDIAPKHCANFDSLVAIKFYDGTAFHRVIPGFVIQGGDPNTKNDSLMAKWGQGDRTQTHVPAEFSSTKHERGILSAARRGGDINSATSQFFICVDEASSLNGEYTVYGRVLSGMDVADKIVNTPCSRPERPDVKVVMTIRKK
ncbi:MAG: peptidylprolyl isomerase [Ignavibacteria bacterium]|nr:peptidylprolyl isomerase [Ignavibacteria bacterium]